MTTGEIVAIVVGALGFLGAIGTLAAFAMKFGKDDGAEVARLDAAVLRIKENEEAIKMLAREISDLESRMHSSENQIVGQAVEKTSMKEMLLRLQDLIDRLTSEISSLHRELH